MDVLGKAAIKVEAHHFQIVTQVVVPRLAVRTHTVTLIERHDDVVSFFEIANIFTDFLNDTAHLVAKDMWECLNRTKTAVPSMQITATNTSCL